MKIVNAGCNYIHPSDFFINRPYGSGDYILLVLKTEAFFVFDNQRQLAPPSSVVIFDKGTPQIYGALSKEYVNDWIHFDMDEEEKEEIRRLDIPFDAVLPVNSTFILSELIRNIFCEKYSQNLYKEDCMNLYFKLIIKKLSEMLKSTVSEKEKPYYDLFFNLRSDIRLSPHDNWSLDGISKRLNLSRSYIQHLYKSFFGSTIREDILQSRMQYARFLLASTDMPVYSVANACGYPTEVHFMRLFKRVTGTTPSEYRQSNRILKKELAQSKNKNPFCL